MDDARRGARSSARAVVGPYRPYRPYRPPRRRPRRRVSRARRASTSEDDDRRMISRQLAEKMFFFSIFKAANEDEGDRSWITSVLDRSIDRGEWLVRSLVYG